jgi:hypothetical protein
MCPIRVSPGVSIDGYEPFELVALVEWVESDGLLRTKADLRDEAIKELGFKRRGAKIVAAIDAAIAVARADSSVDRSDRIEPEKAFAECTQEEKLVRIESLRGDLSDEEFAELRRRIVEGID